MGEPEILFTPILMNLQPDFIQLGLGIRLSSVKALARNLGLSPEGTREYLRTVGVPTATIGDMDYVSLPALDVALHRVLAPVGGWYIGQAILEAGKPTGGHPSEWATLKRIGDLYLMFSKHYIEKRCRRVGNKVRELAMLGLPLKRGGPAKKLGGRKGVGRPRTGRPRDYEEEHARLEVIRKEWVEMGGEREDEG